MLATKHLLRPARTRGNARAPALGPYASGADGGLGLGEALGDIGAPGVFGAPGVEGLPNDAWGGAPLLSAIASAAASLISALQNGHSFGNWPMIGLIFLEHSGQKKAASTIAGRKHIETLLIANES